jgi:hypothetical protein
MRTEEALLLIFMLSGLIVVLVVLWMRHHNQQMLHEERLAALEKGVAVVPAGREPAPWSTRVYLLRGLIWSFTGAALTIGLLGASLASQRPGRPDSPEWLAMRAKSVSLSLQVPIDQAREIVAKDNEAHAKETDGPPAAIALFGLIPLSVGLAYLVFYYSDESRKNLAVTLSGPSAQG